MAKTPKPACATKSDLSKKLLASRPHGPTNVRSGSTAPVSAVGNQGRPTLNFGHGHRKGGCDGPNTAMRPGPPLLARAPILIASCDTPNAGTKRPIGGFPIWRQSPCRTPETVYPPIPTPLSTGKSATKQMRESDIINSIKAASALGSASLMKSGTLRGPSSAMPPRSPSQASSWEPQAIKGGSFCQRRWRHFYFNTLFKDGARRCLSFGVWASERPLR